MTSTKYRIPFTVVLLEDKEIGNWGAYFEELDYIFAEGKTQDEAIHNLIQTVFAVFNEKAEAAQKTSQESSTLLSEPETSFWPSTGKVKKKSVTFIGEFEEI